MFFFCKNKSCVIDVLQISWMLIKIYSVTIFVLQNILHPKYHANYSKKHNFISSAGNNVHTYIHRNISPVLQCKIAVYYTNPNGYFLRFAAFNYLKFPSYIRFCGKNKFLFLSFFPRVWSRGTWNFYVNKLCQIYITYILLSIIIKSRHTATVEDLFSWRV